jgi:hypothetical protein
MKYDVLLTDSGTDRLSTALMVMNTIQQLIPLPIRNLNDVRDWLSHLPILLRRGIAGDEARDLQLRYEQAGSAVAVIPSQLFFPKNNPDISDWRNEHFSEHLTALHEHVLTDWAQSAAVKEGYRFSFFPSYGSDITMRIWARDDQIFARVRRGMGNIGPLPGPPEADITWSPTYADWHSLCQAMATHHFWERETWNTVPDGYNIVDSIHWVTEGWRQNQYHVLVDESPTEGAAHEVGTMLWGLLPDEFTYPDVDR